MLNVYAFMYYNMGLAIFRKNYNQNYVKLAGSNIVFYKDLRASKSQPGSPNGRPEFIVPLHGASVERHGKEKTKRNIKVHWPNDKKDNSQQVELLLFLSKINKA